MNLPRRLDRENIRGNNQEAFFSEHHSYEKLRKYRLVTAIFPESLQIRCALVSWNMSSKKWILKDR